MRVLVQRVKEARVSVEGRAVSEITKGFLLLVGIAADDGPADLERLSKKVAGLRIFEDDRGKMNLDIKEAQGAVLSVPQFTLYANTQKGNRPGFDASAAPDKAQDCWRRFNEMLRAHALDVREGVFGAHMEVGLVNDGPVTIWLDSKQ
jgi:D-tyrosyl-tRNA(Tyr) deacylase